jgi:hypothetical protein
MSKKNNYLHRSKSTNVVNGKKVINEEDIYDSPKGLTMKHYCKSGDDVEKMVVVKKDDGYVIKVVKDGKKQEYKYDDEELYNLLRTDNKFRFIIDFLRLNKECKKKKCQNDSESSSSSSSSSSISNEKDKKDKKDKKDNKDEKDKKDKDKKDEKDKKYKKGK